MLTLYHICFESYSKKQIVTDDKYNDTNTYMCQALF